MASKSSSLQLLSVYGGDSSDEEVPSGRVSTKRCFKIEHDDSENPLKHRLPVPDLLTKTTSNSGEEDPTKHEGKVRSFPHERGNWATYVFISYNSSDLALPEVLNCISNNITNIELKPIKDFHISLTRTVILRYHWISSFVESVQSKLSAFKKFVLVFDSIEVYCNEERTRTFLGFKIKSGYDTLIRLVKALDNCLEDFKLPEFYKDPSFHMSIAWYLGDHEETIRKHLTEINSQVYEIMTNYPENNWYSYITQIECKTGNKHFAFNLS